MGQEMIYISIIILILFLMYVYKKKCDEDYYISIIRSTQQAYMMQNQHRQNYPYNQPPPQFYNNTYPGSMNYLNNNPYSDNFNNSYLNSFKTPENRNYSYSYNNYYNNIPGNNINEISPTPKSKAEMKYGYHNNGNKKHIMEDLILFNKLNNINDISINHSNHSFNKNNNNDSQNERFLMKNNFQNFEKNNDYKYGQNMNYNYVNKKIFKLEDFLSGSKKNNLNDRFDKAANDGFN